MIPAVALVAAVTPAAPQISATSLRELAYFADCTVGREPMAVRQLLRTRPASAAQEQVLRGMGQNRTVCVRGEGMFAPARMRMSSTVMRGALFEASYRRGFKDVTAQPAGAPSVPKASRDRIAPGNADMLDYVYGVAGCTAQRNYAAARTFLFTERGSHDESQALAALGPAIGACVPENMKFTLNRLLFRSTLAEVLYDWSALPAATGR